MLLLYCETVPIHIFILCFLNITINKIKLTSELKIVMNKDKQNTLYKMKALCRRSTDCMLPINHGSRLEDLGFITEELCSTQTAGKKKEKTKKREKG